MDFIYEKDIIPATRAEIYALTQALSPEFFTSDFPDSLHRDMLLQRAFYSRRGGKILACIVYTGMEGGAYINMMLTAPGHSGAGAGSALMAEFVGHIEAEYGLRSIALDTFSPETHPNYAPTVAFYLKHGFTVRRTYPELWGPGTVTLRMEKAW